MNGDNWNWGNVKWHKSLIWENQQRKKELFKFPDCHLSKCHSICKNDAKRANHGMSAIFLVHWIPHPLAISLVVFGICWHFPFTLALSLARPLSGNPLETLPKTKAALRLLAFRLRIGLHFPYGSFPETRQLSLELPDMMSASDGGHGKADIQVAWIL